MTNTKSVSDAAKHGAAGKDERIIDMSGYHMDFIGQRADKAVVKAVTGIEEYEDGNGIRTKGVAKKVEHYTMTCPDCGGDGYFDNRGDVICEDCGVVITDDRKPTLPTEFNEDVDDSVGSSRGLEKLDGSYGSKQPRI
jgi:tRNA(Ile2) C34 agmatinyltransferase TiaS